MNSSRIQNSNPQSKPPSNQIKAADPTQFGQGGNIYGAPDLGQHLQDSASVKGAYGNWASQNTAPPTTNPVATPAKDPRNQTRATMVGVSRLEQLHNQSAQPIPQHIDYSSVVAQHMNLQPNNSVSSQSNKAPSDPSQHIQQNNMNNPLPNNTTNAASAQRPTSAQPQFQPQRMQPIPASSQSQHMQSPQPQSVQARSQQLRPQSQRPQQVPQSNAKQKNKPKKQGAMGSLFGPAQPRVAIDKNSTAYLRNLTPQQLRKEVIQTEIEIQKQLIQSERAYRQGVSTIRDLIAPSSLKIHTGHLEIGTKFVRSFFVLTFPRVISSGWLEGIVNADITMDLSIFVYPRDSSDVLKELKSKVGKIQASLQLNSERGAARDPALETAYRDVEGLRDAIQQGVEKFFRVGIYVSVYADSLEELTKLSEAVESILSQQNIIMKRAALQMDDGFNSTLPINKDDLNVLNNLNTSPLSAAFPFVSSELTTNEGILYGINRHNTSLVIFDRFELENANALVFATSGAGKSYYVKLEILRSLMLGVSIIVIDPEQEYKVLSDTLGGAYINMSLNSTNRINPFDLPKSIPGETTADILRTAVIDLMGLMNLMLGKLNPAEESLMERAIIEAYAKRDITPESNLANTTVPTMSDLVDILSGIVGGESLSQRLYRYTEGTFAGIFNKPTNININNNLIVFNIRDLQETLRPSAMYILLKFVWNEIRSELKRRILAIDEAWIMMQYEDSARFLYGLVKRARKYYLGVTTITQDVGDFLGSPYGKPIVTNAAMKMLLKQSTAAIDLVGDTFALTDGEKQVLLNSEVGQGIFFAGARHVALEVVAFPTEHRIITTNPKDILKMQGLEDSGINTET